MKLTPFCHFDSRIFTNPLPRIFSHHISRLAGHISGFWENLTQSLIALSVSIKLHDQSKTTPYISNWRFSSLELDQLLFAVVRWDVIPSPGSQVQNCIHHRLKRFMTVCLTALFVHPAWWKRILLLHLGMPPNSTCVSPLLSSLYHLAVPIC
jgi:hypothetical protein